MKWFGTVLNSLIILAASTVLLAYLQPIVKWMVPESALQATIELSKWVERPTVAGEFHDEPSNDANVKDAIHSIYMDPERSKFLAMELLNSGNKKITNIRYRFDDGDRSDVMVVANDGYNRKVLINENDVKLPDMKPGDKIKVYMWTKGSFNSSLLSHSFKSFSSSGPFDVNYSTQSKLSVYEEPSLLFDFLDEWVGLFGIFIGTALISLLVYGLQFYGKAYQRLLSESTYFAEEKQRFDTDPKNFVPKG